ncbi:hypothetical protein [Tanapox virus]|uniref:Uncharacterized protein 120.5L n=1 Tax=Tanapox virus TaxID=99000 RepID=A7XCQ4_9POXV|nr:hypothetical protein [Tanapox virus]ABQ43751.1 hypothetical protein [Tanapox virus]
MFYLFIIKHLVKLFTDSYFIFSKIVVGKFLIYMFIPSINNEFIK